MKKQNSMDKNVAKEEQEFSLIESTDIWYGPTSREYAKILAEEKKLKRKNVEATNSYI